MDPLFFAWVVALAVTIGGLFPGAIRVLASRAGGAVPDPALRPAARFAIGLGLVGLVCWIVLSVLLVAR
ncbi:hypothetical protein [Nocardioides sp. TF02-7]|uniref:hypothetical protein n=1 Tax=Nocardioides sp. TF02-7 TaxID=2917724 RepID=UPI001F05C0B1|nr:hypothetical protein [Nocardioides sp. TF02-7]UMG94363.1 hypothetical protein MF408_10370 [Nocardioides sp. TF02-7]